MKGSRRRLAVVPIAPMVVAIAGFAWACTPQRTLQVSPAFGSPGATVNVVGTHFVAGELEIGWRSPDGALVAPLHHSTVGPDGSFRVPVVVPGVVPGPYLVVAIVRADDGAVWDKVAAIEVRGPTVQASAVPGGIAGEGAPQEQEVAGSAGTGGRSTALSRPRGAAPARTSSAGSAVSIRSSTSPPRDQADPAVASDRPASQLSSGLALAPPVLTSRSAHADAWGGFAPPKGGVLSPGGIDRAAGSPGSWTGFAAGVLFLSLGMAVLAAGAGVMLASLRRRGSTSPALGDHGTS
ncbi:MAG: hypothetical protein ACRDJ4_07175 [Actinomycetota bacterium]